MTSHRVISIQRHGKITLAFTKGDANQIVDTPHVVQDASVVRVSKIIPYAGWLIPPSLAWGITALAAIMGLLTALFWGIRRKGGAAIWTRLVCVARAICHRLSDARKKAILGSGGLGVLRREGGGVALIMLIGFIGLAVPLTIASIQTSAQLSRNSRVYDARLADTYNSGSGIELPFIVRAAKDTAW